MKEYIAKKIDREMTVEDERWQKVAPAVLDYVWEEYRPIVYATEARMVHSEKGITVLLSTTEWPIRVTEMENGGRVCVDSCMEFFFTPNESEIKYLNFEINPAGTCHSNIGERRGERTHASIEGKGVVIRTLISHGEGWKAMLFIPYTYIDELYDKRESVFKANFYKCGDLTVKKHFAVWNPIETEKPDYHQPAYFGRIVLCEEAL